jgi:transglutaminase-like putative cysteine protease
MMLDAQVLQAPLLDHSELDLDAARRLTYVIEQSFRYDYDAPVKSLRQRLVIIPPARHGSQYLRGHLLEVTGARARRCLRRDAHGNLVAWVRSEDVTQAVEFRLVAVVERVRGDGPAVLDAGGIRDPRLLRPTRLTAADDSLRGLAADLASDLGPHAATPEQRAERICAAVHSALRYADGVTSVRTTAAEALAIGSGVCQDFAHVMLALCHLFELPARYVSGHLLGQGGTHAWVEVLVPEAHGDTAPEPHGGTAPEAHEGTMPEAHGGTAPEAHEGTMPEAHGGTAPEAHEGTMPEQRGAVAVPFDPCNGRRAGSGYVTVATGRDYADVAPTSGSYVGKARGRLTAGRRVGVLAASG